MLLYYVRQGKLMGCWDVLTVWLLNFLLRRCCAIGRLGAIRMGLAPKLETIRASSR